MFPFDKRPRNPFPRGFEGFFEDFDELAQKLLTDSSFEPGRTYVRGFTSVTGPDGKPHVRTFSNFPSEAAVSNQHEAIGYGCKQVGDSRSCHELTYDVLDEKDNLRVVIDLPGLKKDEIKLRAKDRTLYVTAKGRDREYEGEVRLSQDVVDKPKKATYKNGVLDVLYEKVKEESPQDVKID